MFQRTRNRLNRFMTAGWVVLVIGLSVTFYVAFKPVHSAYTPDSNTNLPQHDSVMDTGAAADAPDFSVIWAGEPEIAASASLDSASGAESLTASNGTDFQLHGVFYDQSGLTMACFSLKGEQSLYGVGDVISDWEITDIDALSVTVVRNGEKRTLRMAMPKYAHIPSRNVTDKAPSRDTQSSPSPRAKPVSGALSRQDVAKKRRVSAVSTPTRLRPRPEDLTDVEATVAVAASLVERLREDPSSVKFGAGFTPNLDKSGKMQGVLLTNIEAGSLAAQYGLAPGDRILAINGQRISSLTAAMQLYQRYRNSDSVRVTIERGGLLRNVLFYAR